MYEAFMSVRTNSKSSTVWLMAVPLAKKVGDNAEQNHSVDCLHDNVLEAKLKRAYELFKIFTGGFLHLQRGQKLFAKDSCTMSLLSANQHLPMNIQVMGFVWKPRELITWNPITNFLSYEPLNFLLWRGLLNESPNNFSPHCSLWSRGNQDQGRGFLQSLLTNLDIWTGSKRQWSIWCSAISHPGTFGLSSCPILC